MRLAVVGLVLLSAASAPAATRFALVVGNNDGTSKDAPLRWAEEDARRVREVLLELGGVEGENAILLLAAQAHEVLVQLAWVRDRVKEAREQGQRTEVLFFYSGHGDVRALHLGETRLSLAGLRDELSATGADAVVTVIDACRSHSEEPGRSKGARHVPAFDISLRRDRGPQGRVFIASAADDEVAQESDQLRASFFSHHLVSGLRGAADSDADGRVTLDEMYRYTYRRTLVSSYSAVAGAQHPEMEVKLEGEGELAVTVLSRASATLAIGSDLHGDILVVDDESGRIIAELRKPSGRIVTLALTAGRLRLQIRKGNEILVATVILEQGERRELSRAVLTGTPGPEVTAKGSGFNPTLWRLDIQAFAASALALQSATALGASAGLERETDAAPLFFGAAVDVGYAARSHSGSRDQHTETRARASAGYRYCPGSVCVLASAGLGALGIYGQTESSGTGSVHSRSTGWTLGPLVFAEIAARILAMTRLDIMLGVRGVAAWARIDDKTQGRLGWQAFGGVNYTL